MDFYELVALQKGFCSYLLGAKDDNKLFERTAAYFFKNSNPGACFGISCVCTNDGKMVPRGHLSNCQNNNPHFSLSVSQPIITNFIDYLPGIFVLSSERIGYDKFPEQVRKYLPGINFMTIPLMPSPKKITGMMVFHKRGEQPFTREESKLASLLIQPAGIVLDAIYNSKI